MKTIVRSILIFACAIALSSCSALAPKPTPTSTPTATSLPTSTSTPTLTPEPTNTPTSIPSDTPTLTATVESGYYSAPDNLYSLIPPKGWEPKDVGLNDPALLGPKAGGFTLNLTFARDTSAMGMDFYSAIAQDSIKAHLQNVTEISEDFLSTPDGLDYLRWEITDTQKGVLLRQIFYFYGAGDQMLIITYTRPDKQGAEYDAAVDQAMQTVRFNS